MLTGLVGEQCSAVVCHTELIRLSNKEAYAEAVLELEEAQRRRSLFADEPNLQALQARAEKARKTAGVPRP